jgi:hypothetical protein
MMKPKDVLLECAAIIGERGADYGNQLENNFARIAEMFELSTGVQITPHQAAIFLVCVKMARMQQSPFKTDNYHDAINYLAFAVAMIEDGKKAVLGGQTDIEDFI